MKILVVDDSKAMRLIVARNLKKADLGALDIVEASSGGEALDLVKAQSPDLVLTDWNMPEMSGLELLRAVRDEELAVKVGVVTSDVGKRTKLEAEEAGALFVMGKPFTPQVFKANIDRAFGRASAQTESVGVPTFDVMPKLADVSRALSGLLPRAADVAAAPPADVKRATNAVLATYGHEDKVCGLCMCEARTALGLAAAMTLLPVAAVEDCLKTGDLPPQLADSLTELFNVLGSLYARSTLREIIAPPEKVPLTARAQVAAATQRLDVTVDVMGYDTGWLAFALI
ncbi:MAG: response regulator [Myxococcales bacterium]|nr:response regulator [Myxococcales bacterium]